MNGKSGTHGTHGRMEIIGGMGGVSYTGDYEMMGNTIF